MPYQTNFTFTRVLSLLLCIRISLCNRDPTKNGSINIEGKIVGGTIVPLEKFPYAVQFFNNGTMCGGVIISSWSVLTAAHCFDFKEDADKMLLLVGSRYILDATADRYNIWYHVVHKRYNKEAPLACDIALIFVYRRFQFSKIASKALLVSTGAWMTPKETNFTAIGWGRTKYGGFVSIFGLMMTNLNYVPSYDCARLNGFKITRDMFCLYGDGERDACQGDSGGGIEWKGMVVGLVSHGDGCAKKDKPGVYANVWYFRNWIYRNINVFYLNYCKRQQKMKKIKNEEIIFK